MVNMDHEEVQSIYGNRCSNASQYANGDPDKEIPSHLKRLAYDKRPGTSGIDGQLYETKLLCLVLLRALKNNDIEEIYLATNMDKIGVFDDIVLRYKLKGNDKPKIIFVQAKHKDKPDKLKVTVEEIYKDNSDFNLVELFYSYCLIRHKFKEESVNEADTENIFQGKFDSVDCEFILYTSANEKFNRKKPEKKHHTSKDDILYTSSIGSTFQFNFESKDVNILMEKVKKSTNKVVDEENMKNWTEDFLVKLKFYTNQAKQMKVEEIVKENIDVLVNIRQGNEFRIETDAIFLKVHDKIQSWWRRSKEVSCLTKSCNYFEIAKQEIAQSPLLDKLNFTFATTIKKTDIEFSNDTIAALGLDKTIATEDKIIVVVSNEITLSCIKVLQYFKANNDPILKVDYTCIDLSCIEVATLEHIISELKKTKITIIVRICTECNDLLIRAKYLIENIDQKVILITDKKHYAELKIVLPMITVIKDEQNRLIDLSSESQTFIENRVVTFQGNNLALGTLLTDKSKHLIHSHVLLALANYGNIEIGNIPLAINLPIHTYNDLKNTYIRRTMSRCIRLQPNIELNRELHFIHKNKNQTIREPNGNQDIIVVSDDIKEYEATLYKHENHNIHWFKEKGEHFIWKKSQGNLERLFKLVNRIPNPIYSEEPNTIKDVEDDLVIVVAEPGMGKTNLLRYLYGETKQKFPNIWLILINLRDHWKIFNSWVRKSIEIDEMEAIKFLCHASGLEACRPNNDNDNQLSNISKYDKHQFSLVQGTDCRITFETKGDINGQALLELELFIQYYKERKVSILIDGFDEVVDYKDAVITLLNALKASNVDRLWITSRTYNIFNELENKMGTFSYALDALTPNKQKEYLHKFWDKYVGPGYFLNWYSFVQAFYDWISKTDEKIIDLISNAQQLYMVAEIFSRDKLKEMKKLDPVDQELPISNYGPLINKDISLEKLYEYFIKVKCQMYEDKVFQPDFAKTSEGKRIIRIIRRDFLENHKKMAILIIFGNSGLKSIYNKQVIRYLNNYIQYLKRDGESTGIVEKIIGDQPKFIHLSYAEYFASEYICEKIKYQPTKKLAWQFLFERLLTSNNQGVRRFFDVKLETNDDLAQLTSRPHIKKVVFSKLNKRNMYECPDKFISSVKANKRTSTALYIAIEENLDNVTKFLLRSVEGYLNGNNVQEFIDIITTQNHAMCVLCAAVHKENKDVTGKILDLISSVDSNKLTDVFNCKDIPYFNPLMIASWISRDKTMVDILLKNLNKHQLENVLSFSFKENYKMSLIFLLAEFPGGIKLILPYIEKLDIVQRMKIFNNDYCNYRNQIPAHNAALRLNFDFFYVMEKLLTRDQFLQVCNTRDDSGWTPIDNIQFNGGCDQNNLREFTSKLGL